MAIEIRKTSFDPSDEILQAQTNNPGLAAKFGATVSFVGTMRDFNQEESVSGMILEYYPGMTEKYLQAISTEAANQWSFLDSLIIHRVGTLLPNDVIVLVVIWSAHRAAAFEACRYIMDELKHRAPFWKKEIIHNGDDSRWVEQ